MIKTAQRPSPTAGQAQPKPKPPPHLLSRIVPGSVGSIIYVLGFTPLEVVKVRTQATAGSPIENPPIVKSFHRGRGLVMLSNGLRLPKNAFPCLAAPQYRVPGYQVPGTNNLLCSRLFESMARILPAANHPVESRGIIRTFLEISRQEGRAGLYAGLRPTLVAAVPNTAVYYTAYDEITAALRGLSRSAAANSTGASDGARANVFIPLATGASARLIASVATAPLELIRVRQVTSTNQNSILGEFRAVLRNNGPLALYHGLPSTLLRDVPFAAMYFLGFETFKNYMSNSRHLGAWGTKYYQDRGKRPPASVEALRSFASGATAGAIAVMLTTPFDLVKTRQQATKGGGGNLGMWGFMRQIIQEEGLAGLWRGNVIRLMKISPGHAVTISCYEFGKRCFEDLEFSVPAERGGPIARSRF